MNKAAIEIKDIAGPLKDYYYVMSGGVADMANPYWTAYKQIDGLNASDLANLWNATAAIGTTRKGLLPAAGEIPSKLQSEIDALWRIGANPNGPNLEGKAPSTILNQKAVNDLNSGVLPGVPVSGPGSPREMVASGNPSVTAQDFALRLLGRPLTQEDLDRGKSMNSGDCPGCWRGQAVDGAYVMYRPAGSASDGTLTTTATVEVNSPTIKALNTKPDGQSDQLKLKFPQTGLTGVAK